MTAQPSGPSKTASRIFKCFHLKVHNQASKKTKKNEVVAGSNGHCRSDATLQPPAVIPRIVIDDSWLKDHTTSQPTVEHPVTDVIIPCEETKELTTEQEKASVSRSHSAATIEDQASKPDKETSGSINAYSRIAERRKTKITKRKLPKYVYHFTSWAKANEIEMTGIIRAQDPHGGLVTMVRGVYLTTLKPSKSLDCIKGNEAGIFENRSEFENKVQVCFRIEYSKLTGGIFKNQRCKKHEYIFPHDIKMYEINFLRLNRNPMSGYFIAEVDEESSDDDVDNCVLDDSDDNADDNIGDYIFDSLDDDIIEDIDDDVTKAVCEEKWTYQDLFPTDLSMACCLISDSHNDLSTFRFLISDSHNDLSAFCAKSIESETCSYIDSDS